MSSTFEWKDFPEGRARFSKGIRGFDELGHETFAIEIDGIEYFGEARKSWLPDRCNYDVEILSFGFAEELQIGMPIDSWSSRKFNEKQIDNIKSLILKLISFGCSLEERPFILRESAKSKFTGRILFSNNWALIDLDNSQGLG